MRLLMMVLASVFGLANAQNEVYLYSLKGDDTWKGVRPQVSFANSSLWVGEIHRYPESERFVTNIGNNYESDANYTGIMPFFSYHQDSFSLRRAYIVENETTPINFTPQFISGDFKGTTTHGFGVDRDGTITFKGENKFEGCQTQQQKDMRIFEIFWSGGRAAPDGFECRPLTLRKARK
ncbi:uncharacterized protein PAC_09652 [Phialocephala subalpina]|uniref:Uncharacterized protein n=1 Tax=Phialocephala subalpina TaxID=576137 RepID=A0A1L7X418_9HELO|nr:uncharacterized protein PAC_09652 [Phialocephala subalpina]